MKQDNAPVKAQSYSHILFTSKHRQQHRLADGNVAIIMLKVCASSKSAIAHVGAKCGTSCCSLLVGTLSRTVQSFSSTSRRNTGKAKSAKGTWCHVVRSRDVRSCDFSAPSSFAVVYLERWTAQSTLYKATVKPNSFHGLVLSTALCTCLYFAFVSNSKTFSHYCSCIPKA